MSGPSFYPQNHVGRGWGIRNGTMGAVRLPKILVLTIDDFVSAQQTQWVQPGDVVEVEMDGLGVTRAAFVE